MTRLLDAAAFTPTGVETSTSPKLVYATVTFPKVNGFVEERGSLWIANADGSKPHRLVAGLYPALSPDGRRVAFFRNRSLYVIDSSGGRPRLIARNVTDAVWSPDSRRIAAADRRLVVIDVTSGQRVTIDRAPGRVEGFSFSPTGDDIVWARTEGLIAYAASDLYRASSSGGRVRRLTTFGNASDPVWGPNLIAFTRFYDDPYTAHSLYQAWLIRDEGGGARRIARGLAPLAWSADGRILLAVARGSASYPPYALNLSTGKARLLIGHSRAEIWTQALSRDGRHVLVSVGRNLVRLPTTGGRPRVLVRGGNRYLDEVADWTL